MSDEAPILIGVDYGSEKSVAVVARRSADGSIDVLEIVEGKGLEEVRRARHDSNVRPSN